MKLLELLVQIKAVENNSSKAQNSNSTQQNSTLESLEAIIINS